MSSLLQTSIINSNSFQVGLVNKPHMSYQFTNIFKHLNRSLLNRISRYRNLDINSNTGLKWCYWSEDFCYYYDILIKEIQTDPEVKGKNLGISNI